MESGERSNPDDAKVWGLSNGWILVFFNDVGRPGGLAKGEMMWLVWQVVSEMSGGHPSRRRCSEGSWMCG